MNIKPIKTAGTTAFKLRKLFTISFFMLFLIIILINAISISVKERSIEPALNDLGNRFLYSTQRINDLSLKIIEQEGLTIEGNGFFSNTWIFIKTFSDLFTQIYILWLWLKILSWFCIKFILWDDSKTTVGYLIGLIILYFSQALILALKGESIMIPIDSILNLFRAIPYIIQPAKNIVDRFVDNNETISNVICTNNSIC